jgi:hypothetical protein
MRISVLASMALLLPSLAYADEHIAGQWRADLGSKVVIHMNVTPDGRWDSQTAQNGQVVAKLDGKYEQTPTTSSSGSIVFTPTQAQTSKEHGAATVERDKYRLSQDGKTLRLTSGGDTMVFHKQ